MQDQPSIRTTSVRTLIDRIQETLEVVIGTAQAFPHGFEHHKPDEVAFSATEIIYHLADVDKLWQSRIMQLTTIGPSEFQRFDPDKTAKDRNYNVQPFRQGIEEFRAARGKTIEMLSALDDAQLKIRGSHPKFGSIAVPDIIEIIANHDLGHAAQFGRTEAKIVR
jgi:uncharacterized damage-inducible protein DinB